MPSALDNLAGPGKALAAEAPDAKEFAGLKRAGLARLKDAQNQGVSLETRFAISGEYEGDLDISEPLVADLIGACKAVAAALEALPPLDGS